MSAMSKKNLKVIREAPRCYYCGDLIEDAIGDYEYNHEDFYVEWRNSPLLYFHPRCAQELATNLIKDVRSGEIKHTVDLTESYIFGKDK